MLLKLSRIQHFIFGAILLELFLGGSGRMIEIGVLTLRMYLFIFSVILSLIILFYKASIKIYVLNILIISFTAIFISSLVGMINAAPINLIALDVKPLLFFLFILIAYAFIQSVSDINFVVRLLKFSGLLLSLLYLVMLFLLYFKYVDFDKFWISTYDYHEFFFRGTDGFFTYKGFLYLGIGFIFWERLTKYGTKKILVLGIILLAIMLTGTRGYVVSLSLIYFAYLVIPKILKGNIIYLILMIMSIFIAYYFINSNDLGDKLVSDMQRIVQLEEVSANVTYKSIIWGHGFGVGIPSKPIHMEIAYLEVFHKQGILGVILWLTLLIYNFTLYLKLKKNRRLAQPFILSTAFVFIMSITNPYMNNPIGLTIILITTIILNILNTNKLNGSISLYSHT